MVLNYNPGYIYLRCWTEIAKQIENTNKRKFQNSEMMIFKKSRQVYDIEDLVKAKLKISKFRRVY